MNNINFKYACLSCHFHIANIFESNITTHGRVNIQIQQRYFRTPFIYTIWRRQRVSLPSEYRGRRDIFTQTCVSSWFSCRKVVDILWRNRGCSTDWFFEIKSSRDSILAPTKRWNQRRWVTRIAATYTRTGSLKSR